MKLIYNVNETLNNIMYRKIPKILYGSWGLLGFYRGIQLYDFRHEEDMKKYLQNPKRYDKPCDFYSHKLGVGMFATIVYIFPFVCVFPAIKELKRLEINLRSLEEEKKKSEYYDLF